MHKHSHQLQKAGIFLTALCAIHCLAMPFVLATLPFLGDYISETFERVLVVVSLSLAFIILRKDYIKHQQIIPLLMLLLGGILQISALFFASKQFEITLLLVGGLSICIGYYINWKLHKKFFHEH